VLVPKDAFMPKLVAKSIRNMRSRSRGRKKASVNKKVKKAEKPQVVEPKLGKKAQKFRQEKKQKQAASSRRFKSPIQRFKSPIRGWSKESRISTNDAMVQMIEDFDISGISEIEMEAFKRKNSSASLFMSPIRFRSLIRRTRGKSKTRSTKKVSQSVTESNGTANTASKGSASSMSCEKGSIGKEEKGLDPDGIVANNESESRGSGMERGLDPDGIVASASVAMSATSKTSNVSWKHPVAEAKSNKKNKKTLRGWEDNNTSDDDVFFVERELFVFSKQLVSKGVNWFNWNDGSKSYETSQIDARDDDDVATEEHNNNIDTWFNWNDAASNDDTDDATREDEDKATTEEKQNSGWFNWNVVVGSLDDGDGSLTDETGGRDANDWKTDDASREGVEVDAMATAEQDKKGWLSPLANYFTNPHLGDIGLTEAEEEDDDRDDPEAKDDMRRSTSRGSGKSKSSLRSKSNSRSKGNGSRSKRASSSNSNCYQQSTGRDSPTTVDRLIMVFF